MSDEEDFNDSEHLGTEEEQSFELESIEVLRQKQRDAVADLNFELADQLEVRIKAQSQHESDFALKNFLFAFDQRCDVVARQHFQERNVILQELHDQEVKFRLSYTKEFIVYQTTHKKALKRFQENQFKNFKDLMNKKIPEFEDLTARARQAGSEGKFKEAQELRDAGRDVQQRELDRRTLGFEENYRVQTNKILDKQREELQLLSDRMTKELEKINVQRKEKMNEQKIRLKRRFDREYTQTRDQIRVRKSQQKIPTRSLNDSTSIGSDSVSVCSAKMSPVYVQELTKRYEEILRKFGLGGEDTSKSLPISLSGIGSRASSQASSVISVSLRQRP